MKKAVAAAANLSTSDMDYFSLLDLPPAFTIDAQQLESSYFKKQRQFHPDRFVGKPAEERQHALHQSMDINQAYETLKNPLKRAQYLLGLQNIVVGTEKDSVKPSQALLIEVMELREEPPAKGTVEKLAGDSITRIAALYDKQAWEAMAQETLRLGYLNKIIADEIA